ncbi:MAG: hypothetical protein NTW03_15500 [Verrucomicrobia bacterium]|nr:hypothetical protein [Verrucomicrobiota bacterium]
MIRIKREWRQEPGGSLARGASLALLALAFWLPTEAWSQILGPGPSNDNLTNAWVLTGGSGTTNGDSYYATEELGEPQHGWFDGSNSVWFTWTPTNSGYYTFDTVGSSFDTVLAVYELYTYGTGNTNVNVRNLIAVAQNDDYNPPGSDPTNLTSAVTFYAYGGPLYGSYYQYRIAVAGYRSSYTRGGLGYIYSQDEGPYVLNWYPATNLANAAPASNQVQFASTSFTVMENSPGYAVIAVGYSGVTDHPVTVDYATSDGTAVAGTDYIGSTGTLTFAPGETNQSFTIPIIDNAVANPNRTINLALTNVTGGAILGGRRAAVLSIVDDETPPPSTVAGVFNFSAAAYRVTENEMASHSSPYGNPSLGDPIWTNYREVPGALVTVTRTGGSTGRVMVDYYMTNKFSRLTTNYYYYGGGVILSGGIYYGSEIMTLLLAGDYTYSSGYESILYNRYGNSPVALAQETYDYLPVSGTLVFDNLQTSTNFVVPIESMYSGIISNWNHILLANLVLANPRPAPEENPVLIQPVLGTNREAALAILEVNGSIMSGTNLVQGFSIEKTHYRLNEYGRGGNTNQNTVRVDVIRPAAGGQVRLWVGGTRSSGLVDNLLPLEAGSDYAEGDSYSYPNPPSTDGSPPIIELVDYTPQSVTLDFNNVTRQAVYITVANDSIVEFNEDIFVELGALKDQPPLGPNILANVTILYDDQPPGALDREWNPDNVSFTTPRFNHTPGANSTVRSLVVTPDQKTIIGGDFTAYNSSSRFGVARLHNNGFVDATFNPGLGADSFVTAVALYPTSATNVLAANQNDIFIGGGFSSYNGTQRNGVARLNNNGSLDTGFNPGLGADAPVRSMAVQSDGKILVAGDFYTFNGYSRSGLARLNQDGSVDTSFNPGWGADGIVWSVAVRDLAQPIYVHRVARTNDFQDIAVIETGAPGGSVTINYDFSVEMENIRVYYEGTRLLDQNLIGVGQLQLFYGPNVGTTVTIAINEGQGQSGRIWSYAATILPNLARRTIVVGGDFYNFNGLFRSGVAQLNDDGSLDTTFDPGSGADSSVYSVAYQADGRVMIGGAFGVVNFWTRNGIARLNLDGSVDGSFQPGAGFNDAVYTLAFQPDGKAMAAFSPATIPRGESVWRGSIRMARWTRPSWTAPTTNLPG